MPGPSSNGGIEGGEPLPPPESGATAAPCEGRAPRPSGPCPAATCWGSRPRGCSWPRIPTELTMAELRADLGKEGGCCWEDAAWASPALVLGRGSSVPSPAAQEVAAAPRSKGPSGEENKVDFHFGIWGAAPCLSDAPVLCASGASSTWGRCAPRGTSCPQGRTPRQSQSIPEAACSLSARTFVYYLSA